MSLDRKTTGAWLVHHTNKLTRYADTGDFPATRIAGKSAILLSALSADGSISHTSAAVHAIARANGIDIGFELPRLLGELKSRRLVVIGDEGSVTAVGLTPSTVLEHSARVFETSEPTPLEQASVELAELCSDEPRTKAFLSEYLGDNYKLASKDTKHLFSLTRSLHLVDATDVDKSTTLFFNGNLFRQENATKVRHLFDALKPAEQSLVSEACELLRSRGCLGKDDLVKILGSQLFLRLHAVGFFDVSVVSNKTDSAAFVTKPSAFTKYGGSCGDDAFDLAKALIASINYGIQRSTASRGRIRMVDALLAKLVAGFWVGPATAIGEDYKVLETKGVLKIKRDGYGFSMKLLKRNVGELAQQVILKGDASEQSLERFPASAVTSFSPPEDERMVTRRESENLHFDDLLLSIRTGRV